MAGEMECSVSVRRKEVKSRRFISFSLFRSPSIADHKVLLFIPRATNHVLMNLKVRHTK